MYHENLEITWKSHDFEISYTRHTRCQPLDYSREKSLPGLHTRIDVDLTKEEIAHVGLCACDNIVQEVQCQKAAIRELKFIEELTILEETATAFTVSQSSHNSRTKL